MAENILLTLNLAVCIYGLYHCFHRLTLVNKEITSTRVHLHVYLQTLSFLAGFFYPVFTGLSWYTTGLLFVLATQVWSGKACWQDGVPDYLQRKPC